VISPESPASTPRAGRLEWLSQGWHAILQDDPPLTAAVPTDARRFGTGAAWNLVAAVFGQGSTLVLGIALANVLGVAGFGAYAIVQNTALTLITVAQLASGLMASKFVAELRGVDRVRTGRVLGLASVVCTVTSVCAAGVLVLGAPFIATYALGNADLAIPLAIVAISVLFGVATAWQTGALAGFEAYPSIAAAALVGGAAALAGGITGGLLAGLRGALVGVAFGAALRCAHVAWLLRRQLTAHGVAIRYRGIGRERPLLLHFALPAALSGLVSTPALWVASAVVIRQPDGQTQLAFFAAANAMRTLVLFVPQVINGVALPMLSHVRGLDQPGRFARLFWRNVLVTALLIGAGALGITAAGSLLLSLYGPRFVAAYPVLVVLMVSAVSDGVALAGYQLIQSEGRMWWSLLGLALPRDLLGMILAFVFVPSMGAMGLALALAVASTVGLLLVVALVYHLGLHHHVGPRPGPIS
jgi:O-antigen/teichoic acid export membrane protein